MEIAIAQLPICQRTVNFLDSLEIVYVHDLLYWTEEELMSYRHFGEAGMREVYAALELIGLSRTVNGKPAGKN